MNNTMTSTPVTYHLFTKAEADEMARFLGEVFAHRDPTALAVGLTAPEFESFIRLYGPKADAEGLTVLARSAATGDIVGALLAMALAAFGAHLLRRRRRRKVTL